MLLTYIIACRDIFSASNTSKIFWRMTVRLSILSKPGMSSTLNWIYLPATSKDDPAYSCTRVVTSWRELATWIDGIPVSNFVVALLPAPERPIISKFKLTGFCILNEYKEIYVILTSSLIIIFVCYWWKSIQFHISFINRRPLLLFYVYSIIAIKFIWIKPVR